MDCIDKMSAKKVKFELKREMAAKWIKCLLDNKYEMSDILEEFRNICRVVRT